MKVMIVNGNIEYDLMFANKGWQLVESFADEPNLICFTGGADVSPGLYKHQQHRTTYSDWGRDMEEMRIYKEALKKGIPMVGICRGGQFLNVMCGGTMYQDVTKHAVSAGHKMFDTFTQRIIHVSSTHHQMMCPGEKAVVVATANEEGVRIKWDGNKFVEETSEVDYEVLLYEDEMCLCFQPHPEFMGAAYQDMKDYFFSLVEEFLM